MAEKTFFVRTYGCQMNVRDTEAVSMLLARHGLVPVKDEALANVVIVNSCSVRGKAEDKAIGKLQMLAFSKRDQPSRIIGVMGCMVQRLQGELFERVGGLDFAVGPRRFSRIPALIDRIAGGEHHLLDVGIGDEDLDVLSGHDEEDVSAFVNILLGCDRRCAYCIVPDVRGPEWSRPAEGIVQEVSSLVRSGIKEVTLLGQSVMRYGLTNAVWAPDAASPRGFTEPFVRLLEALNNRSGLKRLRFTSSHPSGCTRELATAMRELPCLCPHLHLPLQSGSDTVLQRMRRGYSAADYIGAVERLRAAVPAIGLTTDIIIGFPGETADDFEQTRRVMEIVGFDNSFIFKYSPRPGTPAAKWPDDVPEEEKRRRNQVLLEDQDRIGQQINDALVGSTLEVLAEGESLRDASRWSGRSGSNKIVVFAPDEHCAAGDFLSIKIDRAMPQTLYGQIVNTEKKV
ncbi:MAG TPA: tRNA (N6-isopentenyl adenosine(37)-C2)-methylthiotransferase MiaB [Verrucomicrobia bacterium]|nr:tRNA (N6-isopentenyl adenosine(37)-C2)-methylthiotransferase MiaB [Verrucomicrobiota bacterium]